LCGQGLHDSGDIVANLPLLRFLSPHFQELLDGAPRDGHSQMSCSCVPYRRRSRTRRAVRIIVEYPHGNSPGWNWAVRLDSYPDTAAYVFELARKFGIRRLALFTRDAALVRKRVAYARRPRHSCSRLHENAAIRTTAKSFSTFAIT
jgi:hypothetical protein